MAQPVILPTYFVASAPGFNSVVSGMENSMASLAGVSAATATSLQTTSQMADKAAKSAGMFAAAVVIPMGMAANEAIKFEKSMANVSTLMGKNESLNQFNEGILAMAKKTPVAISDLTESLYKVRSAGFAGNEALEMVQNSAILATGALSTTTEATQAVIAAMHSFKGEGLSQQQVIDEFANTVAQGNTKMAALTESFGNNAVVVAESHIKLREFLAATAAMTNTGIPASEAMNSITASIIALNKPTSQMQTVFAQLGVVTGKQLIDKMGSYEGALSAVLEQSKKAGAGELEMNKIFGRKEGYIAATALTGSLNQQYKQILPTMDNVGTAQEMYAKQLGTTSAQMDIAKNQAQVLGIRLGTALLPAINALLQPIGAIVSGLGDFIHNHRTLGAILVGGVAIIGTLTASIAAYSFVLGTLSKATWLVNIKQRAWFLVELAGTAIQAGFAASLALTATAIYGVVSALVVAAPYIAIAAAVIELLIGKANAANAASSGFNEELIKTKEGLYSVVKPATLATEALEKYVEANNNYAKQHSLDNAKKIDYAEHPIGAMLREIRGDYDSRGTWAHLGQIVHPSGVNETAHEPAKWEYMSGIDMSSTDQRGVDSAISAGRKTIAENDRRVNEIVIKIEDKTGGGIMARGATYSTSPTN